MEESESGYKYFSIPGDNKFEVSPGDIIGLETKESSSMWCRNSSDSEIEKGVEDFSDNVGVGVVHFFRAIAAEPVNVKLRYTYNKVSILF